MSNNKLTQKEEFKCNWCGNDTFKIFSGTDKSIKNGSWIECENCSYTKDIDL